MQEPRNAILGNLIAAANGIAREFGRDCEVCIHDLSADDLEHTIIYIINGEITGRKIGDGASNVVLETVEALKNGRTISDHLGYTTRTHDGRILKSSTIFLKDENGEYRYLLGINYDITNIVNIDQGLRNLIATDDAPEHPQNAIPVNVNDLLETLISQSVAMIGKPPALMTKEEKVRAIQFLNDSGAFLVTRSGDKVSKAFGISKFTLYSYIDVNKGQQQTDHPQASGRG